MSDSSSMRSRLTAARTIAALVYLLGLAPAALAHDVEVTAPTPQGTADADRSLSPEERETLARALASDASALGAPAKPLRRRSLQKPAALAVARSDHADGSSAVTVKRPLMADVDAVRLNADVGADVNLAAPPPTAYEPGAPLPGTVTSDAGSGAAWASVGMENLASVDARVDPTGNQGRLAGTLKHSLPVGKEVAVTVQDSYSVSDTLSEVPPATAASTQVWGNQKSVTLAVKPTGTTLGAGVTTASNDPVTHNTLSADQKLVGPLHVTTTVNDIGEASESKSISAGFKLNW